MLVTFFMPALALDKCKEVSFSHEATSAGFLGWVNIDNLLCYFLIVDLKVSC